MNNGLGDTIASITHFFGLDKVADAVAKLAGAPGCGCKERQEYLNQLFPYESYLRTFVVRVTFEHIGVQYTEGTTVQVTRSHPLFNSVIHHVKEGFLIEL